MPTDHRRQHWLVTPKKRWTLGRALRSVPGWTWAGVLLLMVAGMASWWTRNSPQAKQLRREQARSDSLALLQGLEDSVMQPVTDVLIAENAFVARHARLPASRAEYAQAGLDTTRVTQQSNDVLVYRILVAGDTLGIAFHPGGIGHGAYALRGSRLGLVGCGWEGWETRRVQCGYIEAGPVALGSMIERLGAMIRPHQPWWPMPAPPGADSRD